jgi:hypothetical protein
MPAPVPPDPRTPAWHSLYIYCYDTAHQDDVILDAVRPALAVAVDARASFVLRHWRRGPHLRVNVLATPSRWRDAVRPHLVQVIGGYLADHPSTAAGDPEAAGERHRLLAMREEEPGELTPWRPDNSLHEEPFDDRRHVLGTQEAVDALVDFSCESMPALYAVLDRVRAGRCRKEEAAADLMMATAHLAGPLRRSFTSFRAHAEGYLTWAADPAAARAAFDGAYERNEAAMTRRVRDVVAEVDGVTGGAGTGAPPGLPLVRQWATLLLPWRDRIGRLIAEGSLPMPGISSGGPDEKTLRLGDLTVARREPSAFHQLVLGSEAYREAVFTDDGFTRFRVLLNYTYLFLTRLGLRPIDRFRLCHLIWRAVEDAYGISSIDVMRRFVQAHPDPGGASRS